MQNFACLLRPKAAAITAIVLVVLALGVGVHTHGSLASAWKMLQIPANTPLFADTRGITHAIDCVLHGQDPYKVSAFDPWHRLYNYPPVWLMARHLGVTSRSSNLVGLLFAIAAISAYIFLLNARTWLTQVIVFLAIASHCVLFSIERGNSDELVFFLLVSGFFLAWRLRPPLRSRVVSAVIVLLTVLKVYPIAASTVFLHRRQGWKRMLTTMLLAAAALLLTSGSRLLQVFANTPRDTDTSFGTFPFFYALSRHTVHSLAPLVLDHRLASPLGALLLGILGMVMGMRAGNTLGRFLPPLDPTRARGAIATACLSIFCFAFMAGASFDYRLIYLTGALAWLVDDLDRSATKRALPAALLILVLLWKPFWLSFTGELVDGAVFLMSMAWLGNALFSVHPVIKQQRSGLETQTTPRSRSSSVASLTGS
ncbi:MAG TPA: hypothetical protein VFS41_04440 [Edaphobacter sp.]|nr:hypothetical protein [Edaphobacter sp.]